MYTLYYAPGSCALSVHIVLEWVGTEYKAVKVNPSEPDYLKVNPAGAVPALDIGLDEALTQCSAILKYLARRFPKADLDEHENQERDADLTRWSAFLTGDLHPAFFPVFMPQRYTTDTAPEALEKVKAAGLLLVKKKLALIDHRLQGREFFMGRKRTYVDAYSVPMVRWARNMLPGGLSQFPDVARHHDHMLKDSGVVAAMTAQGILGH
jgi:glutathione S-transferase